MNDSINRAGAQRGQPITGVLTNCHVYSNGPCACPYKEMDICRAHSGGYGQELGLQERDPNIGLNQ